MDVKEMYMIVILIIDLGLVGDLNGYYFII